MHKPERNKGKRGKRDGTPEKDDDSASNADSQRKQVIYNEEIARLEINEEEMANYVKQMRMKDEGSPSPTKVASPEPVRVGVRKLIPEDQRPPVLKKVAILKRAPADAPLKPVELNHHMGPRFDDNGQLIPHSILGSAEDFYRMAVEKGTISADEVPKCFQTPRESSRLPVRKTASSQFPFPLTDLAGEESKALQNWEQKMRDRKRQQGYISKLIQRPVNELVMNAGEYQRRINEEKHLIDRSIPFYDYGKGNRVGTEFWKQQDRVGDDDSGVHMTLTQTEKGYAPPIEQVGLPNFVRQEKGLEWVRSPRDGGRYPWKGPFYEQRRAQLAPVINEMCPHEPDFGGLAVTGMRTTRSRPTTAVTPSLTQDSLPRTPDDQDESPDLGPSAGPSLLFGGQPARWLGDPYAYTDSVAIEARVILETSAYAPTSQYLDISNDGTTVLFYRWKKLPKANPFGLVQEAIRKFYFDTSNGVLLPGETLHFPFIFKSDQAGLFTEQWRLETTPVLCGGAALVVTLRGVALQEDIHARRRTELESKLAHAAAERLVRSLVDDLVAGIRERPRPPTPPIPTDELAFRRQNPHLWYSVSTGVKLQQLQGEMGLAEDWNLRKLRASLLDAEDARREELSDKLSDIVSHAAIRPSRPAVTSSNAKYQLCYRLMLESMDKIFCEWHHQRSMMGLPELDMEFPDPTVKKGKEKTKTNLKEKEKAPAAKVETGKSNVARERTKSPRQGSQPQPASRQGTFTETPTVQEAPIHSSASQVMSENSQVEELCRTKIYNSTYVLLSQMSEDIAALCEACI